MKRRLLIVLAGALVGVVPSGTLAADGPLSIVHRPILVSGIHNDAVTSGNWSGYVLQSTDAFSDVVGSWVQPAASCSLLNQAYSSFWVGIDGYASPSVEQLGTDSDCSWTGSPSYYAWWEMYPAGSVALSTSTYPVNPGDTLTAEVKRSATTYTLSLHSSEGWTFTSVQSGTDANASAEWVAEAPQICYLGIICNQANLADFGSVGFTGSVAATGGASLPISQFVSSGGPHAVTMAGGGTVKAQPGPLSGGGTAFTDTWFHS
jgi:hypothetical protein